jgi:hypothetical protein
MYFYGTRLYGRVEKMSSGFYIATHFAHFNFLPLFPIRSWMVEIEGGGAWVGVKLPLQWRSILVTYLRGWGLVVGVIATVVLLIRAGRQLGDHNVGIAIVDYLLTPVVITLAIIPWFLFRKASAQREEAITRFVKAKAISGNLPPARGFDVQPMSPSPLGTADSKPQPVQEHKQSTGASPTAAGK